MSKLTIISNYHKRPLLYWHELTDKECAEFDWIKAEEAEDFEFFRYKDWTYCMSDFMRTNGQFEGWDGYSGDSFFSGVLVKYPKEEWGDYDTENVIVGWYLS
jgi:hypothetical protein